MLVLLLLLLLLLQQLPTPLAKGRKPAAWQQALHRKHDYAAWLAEGELRQAAAAPTDGDPPPECYHRYGRAFLESFRQRRLPMCAAVAPAVTTASGQPPPQGGAAAASSSSSGAECRTHPDAGNATSPRLTACVLRNFVLVNTTAFMGAPRAGECAAEGGPDATVRACTPHAAPGSVAFACDAPTPPSPRRRGAAEEEAPAPEDWQTLRDLVLRDGGVQRTLVRAPGAQAPPGAAAAAVADACDASSGRVVGHPVLLLTRRDTTNHYHTVEHVMNVFVALAALQLPELQRQGVQVLIADHYPPGYYMDIWRRLSAPHPLRFLARDPLPPGTCLRTLVLPPDYQHEQSLLSRDGRFAELTCPSSLVSAGAAWLRALFPSVTPAWGAALPAAAAAAASAPHPQPAAVGDGAARQNPSLTHLKVVWLTRAHYEHARGAALTPWQAGRRLSRERELQAALHAAVAEWNWRSCALASHPGAGGGAAGTPAAAPAAVAAAASPQPPHRHRRGLAQSAAGWVLQSAAGQAYLWTFRHSQWREQRQRRARQRQELAQASAWLAEGRGCHTSSVVFDFEVVELSDLPFYPEQLWTLMRTGVLAGVHGAGLTNMVYTPPGRAALVEVVFRGQQHYHNMATLLGIHYIPVGRGEPAQSLDPREAAAALTLAMDWVAAAHANATASAGARAARARRLDG